jgi:hypothetical protein
MRTTAVEFFTQSRENAKVFTVNLGGFALLREILPTETSGRRSDFHATSLMRKGVHYQTCRLLRLCVRRRRSSSTGGVLIYHAKPQRRRVIHHQLGGFAPFA